MRDVWNLPTVSKWEKSCGKHPTQKPLCLLSRIIQASTERGAWVLDPFTGSSTTGIAANLLGRRFLGIDQEEMFLQISKARKKEIIDVTMQKEHIERLQKQSRIFSNKHCNIVSDVETTYMVELPF